MQLPRKRLPATQFVPGSILLYGLPKVGKTKLLSELDNNLILDLEKGARMYDVMRVDITKSEQIDEVCNDIMKIAAAEKKGYPYKYISLDTVDKLEDLVDPEQAALYRKKTLGTKEPFTGTSVYDLAYGAGYGMIREGVVQKLAMLEKVCEHLIVVGHVKDKYVGEKAGSVVTETDISLSGKLGGIVAAKMDAIGYVYRKNGVMWVSFKTTGTVIRGSRFLHLANQEFEFSWSRIFDKPAADFVPEVSIPEPEEPKTEPVVLPTPVA